MAHLQQRAAAGSSSRERAAAASPESPAASPESDSLDLILDARKSSLPARRTLAVPHQNLNNNILKRPRQPPPRRGAGRHANGKALSLASDQEEAVPLTKKPFVVRRRLRAEDPDDEDVCFDLSVDAALSRSEDGSGDEAAAGGSGASGASSADEDRDDEVTPSTEHRDVGHRPA